ncbi:selenocysteine-specific translation elongation factor [Desulfuromonas acetoxidans]|uniref:Selenocysteine-specific elongation factor n=1 Tax=Desulfuromonas acetoxidans (strain DSM 684 / 11070) TaxID=281689 RepID=Q1JXC6_DESA6|nr:selenocysteine-specific translation elongation factor [Desulfuromonas acetoxidans]EAT14866.1 selenocysteine-specific translation elongation factor [Desulfuromonas acetoxidans DSM 684]
MASQRNIIIGTAGHVDHGKSELIKALTGVQTDRLKEEQQRGISIDLGFAAFDLPNGDHAGVIDVPGHEKFINNMLAGIGGIDLVLLVIDCNEGVMPQTHEHLQILNLLQIPQGIIVMTKVDLADEEWIDIVEEEVREEVAGTFLEKAPMCRVSSITKQGIPQLIDAVVDAVKDLPQRDSDGPMRLPIDRHFSVAGFGTVVTGTLLTGQVSVGDTVEVLPPGEKVRIRDVQVHGKKQLTAQCGQRVALNLAGLERDVLQRGCVISTPGIFEQTSRIDARLTLLDDAPRPIKFRDPVHFHLGTARVVGLVALLDRDELQPGESALVQIHLDKPMVAHRQDRFIIRSYSPVTTIGGGLVIDPGPEKHKRFRPEVMKAIEELESGESSFLLQKLTELQCARVKDLEQLSGMGRERITSHLEQLAQEGKVYLLSDQWLPASLVRAFEGQLVDLVTQGHDDKPLLPGTLHATLKSRLPKRLSPKAFDALLTRTPLQRVGEWVQSEGFQPNPTDTQRQDLERIEEAYRAAGVQAKGRRDMLDRLGFSEEQLEDYLGYLFFNGRLIKLTEDTFFHHSSYRLAVEKLVAYFADNQSLTLGEYRDLLGSARKPVQALLEHFDDLKYTMRKDDARQAWKLPSQEHLASL